MSIDDLLKQIPMDQIAGQLGIDPQQAEQLARQAGTALLGGMEANARDPGGAASLTEALQQHADDPLDEEAVDINKIDTGDGAKIVKHVFGDKEEQVANQFGGLGGAGGSGMIMKLLPPAGAPLVMGFLAKQFANKGQAAGAAEGSLRAGTKERSPAAASATCSEGSSAARVAAASRTCWAASSAAAPRANTRRGDR